MPETELSHGVNLLEVVYGADGPPGPDDPAECYFEASKLRPSSLGWDVPGGVSLERSPELQTMTARAARRNASRRTLPLPEPLACDVALTDALAWRHSAEHFGPGELSLAEVATLLAAAYRVHHRRPLPRRPVPSAGGLYPLDLHVVAQRVAGLDPGLHHYDPFRHGLSRIRRVDHAGLHEASLQPDLASRAAAILVVGASFWRSRFKYGQRALRFCLMEAGHVAQNILLVAAAHGLAARPIGGFLDDVLTANIDYDGVNEGPLYAVLLGRPDEPPPRSSPE